MAYIYKITNGINNKVYVGQTIKTPNQRFAHHIYNVNRLLEEPSLAQTNRRYNMPILRAMVKYGVEQFSFDILEECSNEQVDEKEIYWIEQLESYKPDKGYNATLGGQLTKHSIKDKEANKIILDFEHGLSLRQLADKYHHGESTILILLRYRGIIGESEDRISGRYISIPLQNLICELYLSKHSLKSIASKVWCGIDLIKSILVFNGIEIKRWSRIAQWDLQGNLIEVHENQCAAARVVSENEHSTANHISECCRGKRDTAKGFRWSFWD